MALWTPNNAVVKPLIWLDASESSTLTLNGSGVLNWADKGSDALDAYQTTASLQPQLVENGLNGKPVVWFNGTQYLQFAQTRSLIDKTFILLFDWTEGGTTSFLGDAPQRFQLYSRMNFFNTGYPNSNPISSPLGSGWNIAQADHHEVLNYYANGILDPVTQTRSYTATAKFTAFCRSISTNWTGRIAAFLMLPAPPDEAERQRYEGWLAHHWGVTSLLIPGHPYYNSPPVTEIVVPVSLPNVPDGARYRIWNSTRNAEIENAIVSGGAGISTTFIADDDSVPHVEGDSIVVDVTYPVNGTAYLPSRVLGEVSNTGISGFVAQVDDAVYNYHGIDGSAMVTKFAADFVNDEIDVIVSSNFLGAELYAYYCHTLTFESGIREWLGAFTAIDNANFRVNTSVMSIKLDNGTSDNVWQTDNVRVFRDDGARPVRHPTSGGGGIDINWRSQVYVTIVTTSAGVVTGDISQVQGIVQAGLTAQGYTTARAPKLDVIEAPPSAADNAAATVAAMNAAPPDVNVKSVNDRTIYGLGVWPGDVFRTTP